MNMLHIGQSGAESHLEREVRRREGEVTACRPGMVCASYPAGGPGLGVESICFAHISLMDPVEGRFTSVNATAAGLAEAFLDRFRGIRVDSAWPLVFRAAPGVDGLFRRVAGVEKEFRSRVKAKTSRLARMATPLGAGRPEWKKGWMAFFPEFGRTMAGDRFFHGGQGRMADDPAAPSRSYLKVEEAFRVMGVAPGKGATVTDLGAAPGGWSYSAARRGATVYAVDNGPMKAGAAGHPLISHFRTDGFHFQPQGKAGTDWLFCDMVEDPYRVLELLRGWIEKRWCLRFIVNLKFGRTDPLVLVDDAMRCMRLPAGGDFQIRHLYHDRDEVTLMGRVGAPMDDR